MPPSRLAAPREPMLRSAAPTVTKGGSAALASSGPGTFYGFTGGSTGLPVTSFTALGAATAYACVKRISDDIGKLPVHIHRKLRRGGWQLDTEHPLNRLLAAPNRWQTPSQCWSYFIQSLALQGNGYMPTRRGHAGEPIEILPLNPNRCSVYMGSDGDLFYQFTHPAYGTATQRAHMDNVLHAKWMSQDGFIGVSAIAYGQDVFGLALAAQAHGAVLFRQGAQMNGFIKHPNKLSKEAKEYLTSSFDTRYAGVQNAHRTAVLEEGMTFEKVTMTSEDAQLLESRQFSVIEVARMFGVPPHKIGALDDAHLANVEQGEQQYINDTLDPIANQAGELMEAKLLFDDERGQFRIRHDFKSLLRGDRKTRAEVYHLAIGDGYMSRNAARIEEGDAPVDGLDEMLVPLNMGTADQQAAIAAAAAAPADDPGATAAD